MKRTLRSIFIFLFPFIAMIVINEIVRFHIKEKPYTIHGVKAINSAKYMSNKCTWVCHNNTNYCKKNHVKYLKRYYFLTDIFYYKFINALLSSGHYVAANIIFIVILIPGIILFLFVKALNIQDKIKKLSKN